MERVGLVVLSIVIGTALLLVASYGALYLQPLLLDVPAGLTIAAATTLASLGTFFIYRRRRALTH